MTSTWTKNGEMRCAGVKSNPETVPLERLDTWFELLADRRFRRLITVLERRSGGVTETQELFDHFYRRSIGPDAEGTDSVRLRLRIDFHHRLLPKLASAGVVDADGADGVRYAPPEDFEALFACTPADGFPAETDRSSAAEEEGARDDAVLACLADHRRRVVLCRLRTHGSISLADLADEVTEHERDRPLRDIEAKRVLEVYLSLYHDHIPRLTDAGLVDYDQRDDWVSLSNRSTDLERYRPFLPNV